MLCIFVWVLVQYCVINSELCNHVLDFAGICLREVCLCEFQHDPVIEFIYKEYGDADKVAAEEGEQ